MSDAFTVFIRHEEKVLLMQRADEVADLPGAWDGIYGYGDPNDLDAVVSRIVESTGIPADMLTRVRQGPSRGIAMGNSLLEVTPILFLADFLTTLFTQWGWSEGFTHLVVTFLGVLLVANFGMLFVIFLSNADRICMQCKDCAAHLPSVSSVNSVRDLLFLRRSPSYVRSSISPYPIRRPAECDGRGRG